MISDRNEGILAKYVKFDRNTHKDLKFSGGGYNRINTNEGSA